MNTTTNGLQKVSAAPTIRTRLDSPEFKKAVTDVLPRCLTPERFLRVAILATTRTPKLLQCDQSSFFNALLSLSQYGLEPDGRRAHLIPFENRKRGVTECQLIIDYKGLAELAMRSGVVSYLHADVICEKDEFEYDAGQLKRHKVNFKEPRGKIYAVYAICKFKDGSEKADVMTVEEVEAIRKRSRAGNNGPWVSDWAEMAKKTVFRRLSKWLPLSPEFRDAVDADDEPLPAVIESTAAGLVATVPFELPAEAEDDVPMDEQEASEQPHDPAPKPEPKATEAPATVQANLAKEVEAAGCTFSDFQRWADESGSLPDASSLSSFDDLKTEDCKRILRSFRGEKSRPVVIQQLQSFRGSLV